MLMTLESVPYVFILINQLNGHHYHHYPFNIRLQIQTNKQKPAPAAKPTKAPPSKEEQRAALFTLMDEFSDKSAPEIGGCLKQVGFDLEVCAYCIVNLLKP